MKGPLSPRETKPNAKENKKLNRRKLELGSCNSLLTKEPIFLSVIFGPGSSPPQFNFFLSV